jgi:hypothetical protein
LPRGQSAISVRRPNVRAGASPGKRLMDSARVKGPSCRLEPGDVSPVAQAVVVDAHATRADDAGGGDLDPLAPLARRWRVGEWPVSVVGHRTRILVVPRLWPAGPDRVRHAAGAEDRNGLGRRRSRRRIDQAAHDDTHDHAGRVTPGSAGFRSRRTSGYAPVARFSGYPARGEPRPSSEDEPAEQRLRTPRCQRCCPCRETMRCRSETGGRGSWRARSAGGTDCLFTVFPRSSLAVGWRRSANDEDTRCLAARTPGAASGAVSSAEPAPRSAACRARDGARVPSPPLRLTLPCAGGTVKISSMTSGLYDRCAIPLSYGRGDGA